MKKPLSLYHKFAIMIILAGILLIALLSTVMMERMFRGYSDSSQENYAQGLRYASYSLARLFDSYNDISKFSYYYSYTSEGSFTYAYINYDNLRQILTGENYPEETRAYNIEMGMQVFLRNVLKINSTIQAVHFLYFPEDGDMIAYHAGNYNRRFADMPKYAGHIGLPNWDTESRQLSIVPTHAFDYMQGSGGDTSRVFTIGRNYYNLKGMVGKEKFVGTLLLDFDVSQIAGIFEDIDLYNRGTIYVTNTAGDCLYSADSTLIGKNLASEGVAYTTASPDGILLHENIPQYGLGIYFSLHGPVVDQRMRDIQALMYLVVILAVVLLSLASFRFSHQLTKPMRVMMKRMGAIETGHFDERLPVSSKDEIGQLSARFNKMAAELQNYTNAVYVSQIKQKEAELNALKSQIYPHFLYNTLEVIRMAAVADGGEMVAGMVEALGDQIRYLIGTVGDIVSLRDELSNLEKYVFLINCRYGEKIAFAVDADGLLDKYMPKLVLQPIVENAIIHGLRARNGRGRIQVDAIQREGRLEITVLDDGCGMAPEEVASLENILRSEMPGQKTEDGWRSIGLKNVHDRLRFLYGESYGVSLFSTPGVGTAIKVDMPADIIPKEDAHAENDTGR